MSGCQRCPSLTPRVVMGGRFASTPLTPMHQAAPSPSPRSGQGEQSSKLISNRTSKRLAAGEGDHLFEEFEIQLLLGVHSAVGRRIDRRREELGDLF